MTIQAGIQIEHTRDADPVALVAFLETIGDVKIERKTIAVRGEAGIVQILVTIVGTWAAERYLLEPFANRVEKWIDAISSLPGKQFRISVNFRRGRLVSIETYHVSNPFMIGNLWQIIKSASDLLASVDDEMDIDRVLIVPRKLDEVLVIAYQGTRPTHILDFSSNKILPIKSNDSKLMKEIEQLAFSHDD